MGPKLPLVQKSGVKQLAATKSSNSVARHEREDFEHESSDEEVPDDFYESSDDYDDCTDPQDTKGWIVGPTYKLGAEELEAENHDAEISSASKRPMDHGSYNFEGYGMSKTIHEV